MVVLCFLGFQAVYGCSDGSEEGREWRLPVLLYAVNLFLYGDLEEVLKMMIGCFLSCIEGIRKTMQIRAS